MIINFIKFVFFVYKEKLKHLNRKTPLTWYTSDLHYSHNKVIEYCDRPFFNAHHMNKWITKYWNSVVKPFDTIYILGDFSINVKNIPRIAPLLNGTKILIGGNHDHIAPYERSERRAEKNKRLIYDAGFTYVGSECLNTFMIAPSEDVTAKLSHMPYANEATKQYDKRYWDVRPIDEGHVLLHGHQHNHYIKNGRLIDVGFDGNLQFWNTYDIIRLINDEREFIPSRITEHYKRRKENGV